MSIIYSLRSSNYWDTNVSNKQYRFALLIIYSYYKCKEINRKTRLVMKAVCFNPYYQEKRLNINLSKNFDSLGNVEKGMTYLKVSCINKTE